MLDSSITCVHADSSSFASPHREKIINFIIYRMFCYIQNTSIGLDYQGQLPRKIKSYALFLLREPSSQ
jgi:hypothetical protein